jgi:sucrose-6-phosphate hydrolase SacC (GH32 family)
MTLPRELSLSADRPPCLVQQPVAALAARRRDGRRFPPAPLRTTLPLGPLPPAWDLELRLRAGPGAAAILGWNAPGFRAELRWDPAAGTLVLDRGISSGQRFHPAFARPITMALRQPAESLSLRIVGDRTSLEVFAEEGRSALTARIFPPDGPLELALSAGGGPVSLLSGELHGLAGN